MDEFYTWMNRHEQEFLQDLATMIRIRSVSESGSGLAPYGAACQEALVTMLQIAASYGFEVRDCDGHAGEIFYSKGCTGLDIGIWGHLDVVPEGEGWSYPPYELSREGDFLIGRGVQDNKGPLLAVLYAMRFLKEQKWQPNNGYRLIFGCDEERGMKDVAYFLAHRKAPDYSFVADCGFPVCRGEKGMLVLEIKKEVPVGKISSLKSGLVINSVPGTACAVLNLKDGSQKTVQAEGKAGHAAFPDGTVHAAGILCRKLSEAFVLQSEEKEWLHFLYRLCADGFGTGFGIVCEDAESGKLTCNAGIIDWENGMCRVSLDIRYPVSVSAEKLLEQVKYMAAREGFQWEVKKLEKPFCVPEDHPFVQRLMRVYGREVGDGKRPYIMGGGTYAKKIPHAVGFGPGLPQHLEMIGFNGSRGSCHSADEAQSFTNLKLAAKIYAGVLPELERRTKL